MAREMTKNYYFRKFQCGLSKKDTAKLCFKSVRTITQWDTGQPIPPECRRLMRMHKGIELVTIENEWKGWQFSQGYLKNDQGLKMSQNQILTGYALLEIEAEDDRYIQSKIIKIARLINKLPK
ncbi:regulator [Photobacterium sp. GB-210]|uniref:regulator n=1 Tax=Photobacterium sp. GB-210 TaxID=2022104 RepID=UPI000D156BE3|nr:regulator [Photobacterium sp. GB-210]PSV37291.1 regulator [Photobacterium sp. GB-210]